MRKYNWLMAGVLMVYLVAGIAVYGWFSHQGTHENLQYKVEMNEYGGLRKGRRVF